ncbi:DUF523 domain-containing protein [Selenihalanaerobacter shriftii]|uniref:Uncharacterized conserved protein YbbK, DUF523 family n=1 Tax=Selenihalanaerobacter shriftii TaxID=142842 RepID=A0A1T4JQC7_9FIRM|nr:DUF523 domain-containing protein [Selenihalanaerobacter shriftii]SJZ32442.1 Uncharacterized conserved protein YbbK, DUF523 family [Selenihalanaerobacter shriftii]
MLLVSSCLLGFDCKYNGENNENEEALKLFENIQVIPICPESLAQLPIPRPPAEIQEGDGNDVLDGQAKVIDKHGRDLTSDFIEGAYQALQQAKMNGVNLALLKARSPSCGSCQIYSGNFDGKLKEGDGITAALFKRNGIKVYTEEETGQLLNKI